jgi:hypothetical protein
MLIGKLITNGVVRTRHNRNGSVGYGCRFLGARLLGLIARSKPFQTHSNPTRPAFLTRGEGFEVVLRDVGLAVQTQ